MRPLGKSIRFIRVCYLFYITIISLHSCYAHSPDVSLAASNNSKNDTLSSRIIYCSRSVLAAAESVKLSEKRCLCVEITHQQSPKLVSDHYDRYTSLHPSGENNDFFEQLARKPHCYCGIGDRLWCFDRTPKRYMQKCPSVAGNNITPCPLSIDGRFLVLSVQVYAYCPGTSLRLGRRWRLEFSA